MNTVHVPMMAGALAILALAVVYGIASGQFKKALRQNNRRLPLQALLQKSWTVGIIAWWNRTPCNGAKCEKFCWCWVP